MSEKDKSQGVLKLEEEIKEIEEQVVFLNENYQDDEIVYLFTKKQIIEDLEERKNFIQELLNSLQ